MGRWLLRRAGVLEQDPPQLLDRLLLLLHRVSRAEDDLLGLDAVEVREQIIRDQDGKVIARKYEILVPETPPPTR